MFWFIHMLMAVMQKTLDEMPQAVICRCSGKRITGVSMGLEISELCRKQLNTLTIGDSFGFLCCESLTVQLVSSYSEVLLGNTEHEDRTESDVYVRIYIYKHTCIHIALLYDTTEQNKRKGIREIKMQKISWSICSCSDRVYPSAVTYQCHALWWCPSESFSFAAK